MTTPLLDVVKVANGFFLLLFLVVTGATDGIGKAYAEEVRFFFFFSFKITLEYRYRQIQIISTQVH